MGEKETQTHIHYIAFVCKIASIRERERESVDWDWVRLHLVLLRIAKGNKVTSSKKVKLCFQLNAHWTTNRTMKSNYRNNPRNTYILQSSSESNVSIVYLANICECEVWVWDTRNLEQFNRLSKFSGHIKCHFKSKYSLLHQTKNHNAITMSTWLFLYSNIV